MLGWKVIPRIGFGDFSLSPHGLGTAVGFFVGTWVTARRARSRGLDEDQIWSLAAWAVIGAILGARIAYVVGHIDEFTAPIEWFQIWRGGLSQFGGLLGGFGTGFLYARRKRLNFFELADLAAVGLALGLAVGRIGDLVIGDHLGKPTSGWWGWTYEGGELISPPPCLTPEGDPVYPSVSGCIEPGMTVHQSALYDGLWSLAVFGVLLLLDRRSRRRGFLFLSWASLHALGRIATDFVRVDKTWFGLGLTGTQLASIAVVSICAFLLLRYRGAPLRAAVASETHAVPARPSIPSGSHELTEAGEKTEESPDRPHSFIEDPSPEDRGAT
jgi:phosphatidylglycerol:prolipoprotein diacylglycerol transferase